jgi:hypothetical protein
MVSGRTKAKDKKTGVKPCISMQFKARRAITLAFPFEVTTTASLDEQ